MPIDLHSHVLPGIDDGPPTWEGSIALARAAAASGTRTLLATPHVSPHFPNASGTISRLTGELNERLAAEGIELEILPAGEIAMSRLHDLAPEELTSLGFGAGRWLLVEPPFTPVLTGLDTILADLQRQGHRVLLAHPERCAAFQRDPELLFSLVRGGVLTSITASSLTGAFGSQVRRFALSLVREGIVHNVASDAHDHANRPPGVALALEQTGLGELATWLTEEVPAAILSDTEIPPRPEVSLDTLASGRRSWWRRG